jgi:hypothetical protein
MTGTVIAWFDPGKTTGGALYDTEADHFASGQYTDTELRAVVQGLIISYAGRLAVGWELYIQTSRAKPGTQAKHSNSAITIIEGLCEKHDVPVLKGQPSSARSLKSSVVFLRRLGWYVPGQQHANDAAAHLFRHLIKQRPVPGNIRTRLPAGY